jgi:hypothetical protein
MLNLVLIHTLSNPNVILRMKVVHDLMADRQSPEAIFVLGSRCPRLIQTRWVYLVDALEWMLQRIDSVNTVRASIEHPPLPDNLKTLFEILPPSSERHFQTIHNHGIKKGERKILNSWMSVLK